MARKMTKRPDEDKPRSNDEGSPKEQPPLIPKARRLGASTYVLPAAVSTPRKPIPEKHRKTKAN
jgi:hypothetical protein